MRRRALAAGCAAAALTLAVGGVLGAQEVGPASTLIGKPIATFAFTEMDDSTNIISPLSLRGSVVLIDLWGTWCAPCRREMPFLHAAYAKYRDRGLQIVSIAFDASPGVVQAFRRTTFPMPWLHVYATPEIEAVASRLFRLDGFPRTVLLARDGVVLRVDEGLRGPALDQTLAAVFSAAAPPRR